MKINDKEVIGHKFAYDGCHKIYIIENNEDEKDAIKGGYKILPIEKLEEVYNESCPLRFIDNWKLNKFYAPQGEIALFSGTNTQKYSVTFVVGGYVEVLLNANSKEDAERKANEVVCEMDFGELTDINWYVEQSNLEED